MGLLTVRELTLHSEKDDQKQLLLNHVSLSIQPGEWIALIGPSGCGKSTLMNAILGFLQKDVYLDEGDIAYGDIVMTPKHIGPELIDNDPFEQVRGTRMTYVMQNIEKSFDQIQKTGKQIEEVFRDEKNRFVRKEKAMALLEAVGVNDPKKVYRSYPMQLSPGTLQKIMIGMAAARGPELVLLDEPFSALDQLSVQHMVQLLKKTRETYGTAGLMATHSFDEAVLMCDQCCFMRDGGLSRLYPISSLTEEDMRILTEI